jgi:hypothetical protein
MAVMLRTLGIPARVAVGYTLDANAFDLDSGSYQLTERNAYAWPEVYFPGIGWVEFSPEPGQPLIQRPGAPADGEDREPIEDIPIDPSEPDVDLGIDPADRDPGVDGAGQSGGGSGPWRALISLAIIGAIAALVIGGARVAWEWGMGGLAHPAQLWEKTQRLARWGNHGAQANETPREFAGRLERDVPGADGAAYIAAAYERSRFGQKEMTEEETEKLDAAWAGLRNTLMRSVLRLKPRG